MSIWSVVTIIIIIMVIMNTDDDDNNYDNIDDDDDTDLAKSSCFWSLSDSFDKEDLFAEINNLNWCQRVIQLLENSTFPSQNSENLKLLNLHLSIVQSALQYGHVVSPLFSHSLIQFAWYSWPHDRGFASSQHILSQQMQHWRFSSLTSNKCSFPCSSFCLYSLFKCSSFLLYLW